MGAARLKSEPFSNVDAAWLRMDSPTNLAVITGVLIFNDRLDFERLKATIEHRLLIYPRFMQRVKFPRLPLGLPRWETDPHFDLGAHLHRVALPEPANHQALEELAGDLMSVPLDLNKPLWQFYYVENYGSGSALIGRLHHCIGDGMALMRVLLSMADDREDAPWPEATYERKPRLGRLARLLLPAVNAVSTARKTWRTAESLVHEGMDTLVHPSRMLDWVKVGTDTTKALGKLLLIPPDRKTLFRGKCGVSKRATWSTTLKVEEVKLVGQQMGGTINDVLLTAVTGALRRYLESWEQPVNGLNIRAIVPVNLRSQDEMDGLGNRFGLVFLSLPLGVRDAVKRLKVLKRRMDAIKNSPEAVVAIGILNAIGMTPQQIEDLIVNIFGMKGTAVMTNVPGPRQALYMAGSRINSIMFWVPAPANLSMGVSILSYAGEIILGIQTDACLLDDPEAIITAFQDEFEQMKRCALALTHPEEAGEEPEAEPEPEAELDEPVPTVELQPQAILESPNGRCTALTRSGQPCRNRALPGEKTCRVHS